jgi:hypothetical protein
LFAVTTLALAGEPAEPLPAAGAAPESVDILRGQKDGAIQVIVRGQGADRVKFSVKNTSAKRLRVVIPPGLVASSALGQGPGGGGGGGFQSMGLGLPTNSPGSFGQFHSQSEQAGFQSIGLQGKDNGPDGVLVAAGGSADFIVPSVCLNFGIATPTPRNIFKLMTVEDYTTDARARKALKSAAVLGTSQGVAQAAMWNVFNGMSFEQIAIQAAKYVNVHEITLAARFVAALDASSNSDDLIEPAYFSQGRILVRVQGDASVAKDVRRLSDQLEPQRILGLPVRIVDDIPPSESTVASLFLDIALTSTSPRQTNARVTVRHSSLVSGWRLLGSPSLKLEGHASDLTGAALVKEVDRAIGSTFVFLRPTRHTPGMTTFRIENRLPFTIAGLRIRTGRTEDAGAVTLERLGLGPARSAVAPIPTGVGVVEKVELNGL